MAGLIPTPHTKTKKRKAKKSQNRGRQTDKKMYAHIYKEMMKSKSPEARHNARTVIRSDNSPIDTYKKQWYQLQDRKDREH